MKWKENQKALQDFLIQEYEKAKLLDSSLSLRTFAKRLDVTGSALSQIIRSKRRVSQKKAVKMLAALNASEEVVSEVLKTYLVTERPRLEFLDLQTFQVVSEWYHFAILSLIETKGFDPDPRAIAKRLGITVENVESSLTRLFNLNFIRFDSKGDIYLCKEDARYSTPDGMLNEAVQKSHISKLSLAMGSLSTDSVDKRDFTSVTMAINVNRIAEAKVLIREFEDRLSKFLEVDPKSEVYELCVQLFPISR